MSSKPGSSGSTAGWSERGISVLNGVVGDYLDRNRNGLAIPMTFVQDTQPLVLTASALRAAQPALTGKLVILVHGWCCNEEVWRSREDGATYATRLQHDLGFTPFAVRYNTGMPVADNGAAFAPLLTALVDAYPRPIDDIVLIGHSMGGLVIRSACQFGLEANAVWLSRIRHAFYLGTPHDGADLERFAQGATVAMTASRNPITQTAVWRATQMNMLAGKHFNSGLRGVFFSIGYLGWFVDPVVFVLSTLLLLAVLVRRQFFSAARRAVIGQPPGAGKG